MKQTFKIFVVKNEPYLTVDENVVIGDKAIVSVNDMYPRVVDCANEVQIDLFQKPLTSMTKRYKIVMGPNELNLEQNLIDEIQNKEVGVLVEYEDGEITIIE